MFIHQLLAWYRETGSMKDQTGNGYPCDICTQKQIHAVHDAFEEIRHTNKR